MVEYVSGLNQVPQTISFLTIGVQVAAEATVCVEALNVDVGGQVARVSPLASGAGGRRGLYGGHRARGAAGGVAPGDERGSGDRDGIGFGSPSTSRRREGIRATTQPACAPMQLCECGELLDALFHCDRELVAHDRVLPPLHLGLGDYFRQPILARHGDKQKLDDRSCRASRAESGAPPRIERRPRDCWLQYRLISLEMRQLW